MIGTTISRYRILEKLGGGGMGVVYSDGYRSYVADQELAFQAELAKQTRTNK